MTAETARRSLPPLLAALTVLVLALLPPRLSLLGDETGVIHTEVLGENSNFPARPPAMPGRIALLARWEFDPDALTIVEQLIEGPEALAEAAVLARTAVEALTEAGVLPSGQPEFDWGENFTAARLYLRDQTDLSSAGFLTVWTTDGRDYDLSMVLDLESGRALSFRLTGPAVWMEDIPPEDVGARFLDALGAEEGLSYEPLEDQDHRSYAAAFRLTDCRAVYRVLAFSRLLEFAPEPDREPEESAGPHSASR